MRRAERYTPNAPFIRESPAMTMPPGPARGEFTRDEARVYRPAGRASTPQSRGSCGEARRTFLGTTTSPPDPERFFCTSSPGRNRTPARADCGCAGRGFGPPPDGATLEWRRMGQCAGMSPEWRPTTALGSLHAGGAFGERGRERDQRAREARRPARAARPAHLHHRGRAALGRSAG
jgi:hypothetical protein